MRRLLLIDDDESMRKLLRFQLESSYQITDTSDPEQGIVLALQQKPDAILLDLMMPRYSGFEVCQTLSSLSFTQNIPIFIVSGESSARYEGFCRNLGAKGFFQKPVDFERLRKELAAATEGKGTTGGSNYAMTDGSARFIKFPLALDPLSLWANSDADRAAYAIQY